MPRLAVIVPAAGAGARMGGATKPFLRLGGEPVLVHALRPFLTLPDVARIVVALPAAEAAAPPPWLTRLDRRIAIVLGGAERSESVLLALDAVPDDIDLVIVHDAARPLVTQAVIARSIAAAKGGAGATAGIGASDTIHEVDDDGVIVATPDRARLRQAQTPQVFPRALLAAACRRAAAEGVTATDEAALFTRYGGRVTVVDGDRENLKVTVPSDLAVAESILRGRGG
jgi:2-C-methyl-D-erythritol 4-phosphate cytidylyltransferase